MAERKPNLATYLFSKLLFFLSHCEASNTQSENETHFFLTTFNILIDHLHLFMEQSLALLLLILNTIFKSKESSTHRSIFYKPLFQLYEKNPSLLLWPFAPFHFGYLIFISKEKEKMILLTLVDNIMSILQNTSTLPAMFKMTLPFLVFPLLSSSIAFDQKIALLSRKILSDLEKLNGFEKETFTDELLEESMKLKPEISKNFYGFFSFVNALEDLFVYFFTFF